MKKLLTILGAIGLTTSLGTNVISCNQEKSQLKIEVDQEQIDLFPKDETEIKITNFDSLKNINVTSNDVNIIQIISNDQGIVKIKAVKEGNTEITISANGVENKNIQILVNPLNSIFLDKYKSILYIDDNDDIQISHFEDLEDVKIEVVNQEIISAELNKQEGKITILGLKEGATKIKISATHAIEEIVNITVYPKTTIEIEQQKFIEYIDEGKVYSEIKNFRGLTNLRINENTNSEVATATINETTKNVEIELLKPGTSTIKLLADHSEETWISVEVLDLEKFEVDNEKPLVDVTKTTNIQITKKENIESKDIQVTSQNEEIATATFNQEDNTISVVGISEGTTQITIAAKHAVDKILTVTTKALEDLIVLDKTEISMDQEETENVQITSINNLTNVQVKTENEKIAKVELDSTTGIITVTGMSGGTTQIIVTADHAIDKKIEVDIQTLAMISIPTQKIDVGSNDSDLIQFYNYFELNNVQVTGSDENLFEVLLLPDENQNIAYIKVLGHFDLGHGQIIVTADHAKTKIIEVNIVRTTISLNKEESWIKDGRSKIVRIDNFADLKNVQVTTENDKGSATLKLDPETGEITVSIDKKGGSNDCLLQVAAENAVTKTIPIYMMSKSIVGIISASNVERVVKEWETDDELNFNIAKGTKASEVESELKKQLGEVFKNSGFKPNANVKKIKFNNLPSQAELDKVGIWNSADDGNGDSTITFTIGWDSKIVDVKCQWWIFIKSEI